MAISAKELYEQSLKLDESERTALAALILDSLEPGDADAEEAWVKEIERRLLEMVSCTVQLVSWESVRARLSRKRL